MAIRILHIVSYMQRGGLETLLMNCYRHIDREKIQFDFMVHRAFRADYDDEIESLGGRIYRMPRLNPFSINYKKELLRFFQTHPEYRIVHCHLDCMSALPLAAARKCGVPVRIAHAHNSNQDKDLKYILKRYYMTKIPGVATQFFACSKMAGEFMFPGQNVFLVNNGIETEHFEFDPIVREEVRTELALSDALVVGHVGRFVPQKNHGFLIDIFEKIYEKNSRARLLLVGEGPLEEQIQKKIAERDLEDAVVFMGVRADVNRILQAVDVFVLPSLYEGLALTCVEAQTSGLSCVISDSVSQECSLTDLTKFVSLEQKPSVWADVILRGTAQNRKCRSQEVRTAGFDISTTAQWLKEFYLTHWR